MMECTGSAGYAESRHSADWCLNVWAPDFSQLLNQAVAGMQSLMGVEFSGRLVENRRICLDGADPESLLVAALNEVLFLIESERLGVANCAAALEKGRLCATLGVSGIARQEKEIKAVTYHNLRIRHTEKGLETSLVFDV